MLRYCLAFACLFIFSCRTTKTGSAENRIGINARVFSLDATILKARKTLITGSDSTLVPAYDYLISEADKALNEGPFTVMEKTVLPPSGDKHDYMSLAPYFWPDPSKKGGLPYTRKDGQTNPEVKDYPDKTNMPRLVKFTYTLALAYYFSGEEKYAQHAAKLLRVWFINDDSKMNPNLNFAQAIKGVNEGRGAGLIDTRHFIKIIDAIGLLQTSQHWTPGDQQSMQNWFRHYLQWMHTSRNGLSELNAKNNHGTWYDAQRLSFALFIDSTPLAKSIISNSMQRLDQQMDANGQFPLELERTMALHYSCFDLQAFFIIAQMSDKLGIDIWHTTTAKGNSIEKGFRQLLPYLTGKQQWPGKQIRDFDYEEDAFPLLFAANQKYQCTECLPAVIKIAGKEGKRLREWLLW